MKVPDRRDMLEVAVKVDIDGRVATVPEGQVAFVERRKFTPRHGGRYLVVEAEHLPTKPVGELDRRAVPQAVEVYEEILPKVIGEPPSQG
jgi:hypothetical protein